MSILPVCSKIRRTGRVELAPGVSVDAALNSVILGHTTEADQVIIDGESLSLDSLLASWMGTLENIFPSDAPEKEISREIPLFTQRNGGRLRPSNPLSRGCLSRYSLEPTVKWIRLVPLKGRCPAGNFGSKKPVCR